MTNDKALEAAHAAYAKTGGMMEGHPMANAISAYFAALPGEAEAVAHAEFLGGRPTAVRLDKSRHCTEPLVTLASLQAMQARAEAAERERDDLQAARNENAKLRGQRDAALALAKSAEACVKELEEALNLIDALDPEEHLFGVSHDACRGLIARMGETARTALKGGSNG